MNIFIVLTEEQTELLNSFDAHTADVVLELIEVGYSFAAAHEIALGPVEKD
jgi:hypothetical protein